MSEILKIENLYVYAEDKELLRDINLTVGSGEIHVLMGHNGAGKSTHGCMIMGRASGQTIPRERREIDARLHDNGQPRV